MQAFTKSSLVALALFLTAGSAWAYPVTVGSSIVMKGSDSDNTAYLGNYQVYSTNDKFIFGTFCVEYNEHFYSGGTYQVKNISSYAENGGLSGGINYKDELDYATKWLYSHFLQGNIHTYLSDKNTKNLDFELQQAIWKIEGEYNDVTLKGDAKAFYDLALNKQAEKVHEVLAYEVSVMNLTSNNGKTNNQSQLIAQPVPEPSTMLLVGAGLIGLGFARRKAQNKK